MGGTVETYGAVLKALDYIEEKEEARMKTTKAHLLALSAIMTCPKVKRLDAGKDLDCSRCAFGHEGAMPLCSQVKVFIQGKKNEHDGEQDRGPRW